MGIPDLTVLLIGTLFTLAISRLPMSKKGVDTSKKFVYDGIPKHIILMLCVLHLVVLVLVGVKFNYLSTKHSLQPVNHSGYFFAFASSVAGLFCMVLVYVVADATFEKQYFPAAYLTGIDIGRSLAPKTDRASL